MAWGQTHTTPEADIANLRSELDACRAEIARLRTERNNALDLIGPKGIDICERSTRVESFRRNIAIARRVAQHHHAHRRWACDAVDWPLAWVMAALDGETRPAAMGVVPGPDADVIEEIAAC